MYSANALMHISTCIWCMSLVGQWLFYSFFLFIRMSVHLSCMFIDNRCCYFNSVNFFFVFFRLQVPEGAKNHNTIALYVVELLINSSLYFFLSFVLFEYLMTLVSSLKRLPQLLDLALSHYMISTAPEKTLYAFTTMALNCFQSQTK